MVRIPQRRIRLTCTEEFIPWLNHQLPTQKISIMTHPHINQTFPNWLIILSSNTSKDSEWGILSKETLWSGRWRREGSWPTKTSKKKCFTTQATSTSLEYTSQMPKTSSTKYSETTTTPHNSREWTIKHFWLQVRTVMKTPPLRMKKLHVGLNPPITLRLWRILQANYPES